LIKSSNEKIEILLSETKQRDKRLSDIVSVINKNSHSLDKLVETLSDKFQINSAQHTEQQIKDITRDANRMFQ
jgi:hypothetical protein